MSSHVEPSNFQSIHPESQRFEPQASCSGTAWEAQGIGAWPRSETCAALRWNSADGLSIGTRASFEFVDGHSFWGTNFSNSEESELDADTTGPLQLTLTVEDSRFKLWAMGVSANLQKTYHEKSGFCSSNYSTSSFGHCGKFRKKCKKL